MIRDLKTKQVLDQELNRKGLEDLEEKILLNQPIAMAFAACRPEAAHADMAVARAKSLEVLEVFAVLSLSVWIEAVIHRAMLPHTLRMS